jgi:hypothetical protein
MSNQLPHAKAKALHTKQKKDGKSHMYVWEVARHPFSRNWTSTVFPGFCPELSYRCIEKLTLNVVNLSRGSKEQ